MRYSGTPTGNSLLSARRSRQRFGHHGIKRAGDAHSRRSCRCARTACFRCSGDHRGQTCHDDERQDTTTKKAATRAAPKTTTINTRVAAMTWPLASRVGGATPSPWKRRRVTRHDHNPVNNAMGNGDALRSLLDEDAPGWREDLEAA